MNLQKTRTLNVSSHANPAELHDAMTAKLQAAVAEADEQPQVIEAAEVHQKAESQLARLRQAHRTLNDSACRLSATLKKSLDEQVSRAIELAGDGRELEAECLADCARLDIQHRVVVRGLQRCVEQMLPEARRDELYAHAAWLRTRGNALQEIAQVRAEQLVADLSAAVEGQGVVSVDTRASNPVTT